MINKTNKLEFRMYGFVPYNISDIQKGIQFGHGVVEYSINYSGDIDYDKWKNNDKTFIILNGGPSNINNIEYGMNSILNKLNEFKIKNSTFFEPDLNDMLSAIVFLVDERVFNKKDYPDFSDWILNKYGGLLKGNGEYGKQEKIFENIKYSNSKDDKKIYDEWVNLIGGTKNAFLREFLKEFRLA